MTEIQNSKQYDLEDRTFEFARRVRAFVKKLPKTLANIRGSGQLGDEAGSVRGIEVGHKVKYCGTVGPERQEKQRKQIKPK